MIMFAEINSFAYLSIFSLTFSGLNHVSFNIGIVILVTKTFFNKQPVLKQLALGWQIARVQTSFTKRQ